MSLFSLGVLDFPTSSSSLSGDPLSYIGRTVSEFDALFFAEGKRPYSFTIYENVDTLRELVEGEKGGVAIDLSEVIIEAALAECRGRVAGPAGAAVKLGIPQSTLVISVLHAARFQELGPLAPEMPVGRFCGEPGFIHRENISGAYNQTDLSMAFCNSRILPGQSTGYPSLS